MGKVKMAETLTGAGLHLGVTTGARILKEKPVSPPESAEEGESQARVVTSKYTNHVWLTDLTTISTGSGLWCSWTPFAVPQCWPFCWWLGIVIDHFSRRVIGFGLFANRPDCRAVCSYLGQTVRRVGRAPKYVVCDRDSVFDCEAFRGWVKGQGIQPPRYGAVGKHGSIAIVERMILTTKQVLRQLPAISPRRESFRRELTTIFEWYHEVRPHMTLGGRTPNEVYFGRRPANRRSRIEPRSDWPRGSPCSKPWAVVAGKPGARFRLEVAFHAGRRHLPIVSLKRAA
jgi:transposase InsO family protein